MDIYQKDGMAFVRYNKHTFLCIGSIKEVDKATPKKIIEMVKYAVAYSAYQQIEQTRHQVH